MPGRPVAGDAGIVRRAQEVGGCDRHAPDRPERPPMFGRRRIRRNGERALARVLSCEKRSSKTTNELRDYDYVLEVRTTGGETFTAQVRDKFWMVGLRPAEGDEGVPVRFDATSRETIFDLEGDARYDVKAMNARSAEMKRETRERTERFGPGSPVSPPPAPAAGPDDALAQLERLVRLRDAGALTEEEFASQKARILAG